MTLADRVLLSLAALAVSTATASAQSADAEALFRDGRAMIKKGDLEGGCEKLAASERIESSVGTLLNLGDCREKLGKLASAWAAFRKAEAMAQRAGTDEKRRAEAARRASALEPKLSNIVVVVAHPVPDMVVRRDDDVLDPATLGTPLPVDPGKVTISAEAPGYTPWHSEVEIDPHSKRREITVPDLVRAPAATPVTVPASPIASVTPVAHTRIEHSVWSGPRKASLVVGVIGAGALGTGIYFGVHARNLQHEADQVCPGSVCSDPGALHTNDRAQSDARAANILYAAGGAAVATAVVMWFVGGPTDETVVVPTASDHQVGLSWSGSF
jgi:hypothetical protein